MPVFAMFKEIGQSLSIDESDLKSKAMPQEFSFDDFVRFSTTSTNELALVGFLNWKPGDVDNVYYTANPSVCPYVKINKIKIASISPQNTLYCTVGEKMTSFWSSIIKLKETID
jgi:hypothetical protein